MKDFSVGQEVVVFGGALSRQMLRTTKIAEIGKRKIKCADESEWTVDGDAWGSSKDRSWHRSYIIAATDEHKAQIARNKMLQFLSNYAWSALTNDSLRGIIGSIKELSVKAES